MRHADRLPKWGTEQVFEGVEERLGGQGANFAAASARLGVKTSLLSSVGNDDRGKRLKSELESVDNLDCSLLRTERSRTGFSIAAVGRGGDRYFLTFLGHQSAFRLEGSDEKTISMLGRGDIFHVSGYFLMPGLVGKLGSFLNPAKARGAIVSFDPGWSPNGISGPEAESFWEVMKLVDWFFPNEDELKDLTQTRSILSAARVLKETLPGLMVVKRGGRGCVLFDEGRIVEEATGFKVNAVDSVGAGDAFDAGFLAGIGRGYSHASCAKLGNATAALVVSRGGRAEQKIPIVIGSCSRRRQSAMIG